MCVSTLSGALPETWREYCVLVDDTICGGLGSLFFEALSNLRHRFPFSRKFQCLLQQRKCETILQIKLKFMRFVVLVAVSVGWLVKHVWTCPVK